MVSGSGQGRVWRRRSRTDFELATLEYINWFNTARLHGELDHLTPPEFEEAQYRAVQLDQLGLEQPDG